MKENKNQLNFEQNISPSNYCLVQLIDQLGVGDEFTRDRWPRHVTLAGVFATRLSTIAPEFDTIAQTTPRFHSSIIHCGTLGYNDEVAPVAYLEKSPELDRLHRALVATLTEHDALFKHPTFFYEAFTPHVTDQANLARLAIGSIVQFDKLSLVDLAPDGDRSHRRIVWEANLTGENHV